MTTYVCDTPDYVPEYYQILEGITHAQTNTEFEVCQQRIDRFLQKYGTKVKGFWWFTWTVDDKAVHSAWESLQKQLLFRMNYVYDTSRTFGR